MTPLVSVIIPAYNAGQFIREALDSALAQTWQDTEIIVVDDGSPQLAAWVTLVYPGRVTYVWKTNGGPASARNAGIRRSRGEFLAFLDADDVWEPDKLATQLAAFQQHPEAGMVYAAVRKIDEAGRPVASAPVRRPSGRIAAELFMGNVIPTSTVVIRRKCLEAVGLFDESPELISVEDYDLWLRFAERFDVVAVDRPLVRYRVSPSGISQNTARSYAGEQRVIERAVARAGSQRLELAALLPRRLAQLHFACGHEYFTAGRLGEARTQFAQSLRHQPGRARTWLYYAATFLGSPAIAQARRLKRRTGGPVRVMHVLNTLETGGAEHVVLNVAQHLDRAAFDVHVCSLAGDGPLAREFQALGVPVHAVRRRPGVDLGLPFVLARLIRRERIDLVHTHNAGPWLYGGLAAKLAGARLCHTEHSNLFPHQRRMLRAERWLARWTEVIISDSEKVKRHLVERQGVPAGKIRVVVNGVDTRRFGAEGGAPAQARRLLGLNGDQPVVGTVGRLVPVKDHRTLLAAFRRVAEQHPAGRLVIVGDGPLRGDLVRLAGTLGLSDRVRFLGERRDIPQLLRAFDLFVLSSVSEGMPLTVLEAMAAGVPVVATRVGGVPEAVVDRETGWLVPPGDPESMAGAVLALLADPARRAALGRRAQERACGQFDVQQMADAYARAYRH